MAEEKILTENELDGVSGGMKVRKELKETNVLPRKDDYYVKTAAVTNGGSVDTTATVLADTDLNSVTGGGSLTGCDNTLSKRSGIATDVTVTTVGSSYTAKTTVLADSALGNVTGGSRSLKKGTVDEITNLSGTGADESKNGTWYYGKEHSFSKR